VSAARAEGVTDSDRLRSYRMVAARLRMAIAAGEGLVEAMQGQIAEARGLLRDCESDSPPPIEEVTRRGADLFVLFVRDVPKLMDWAVRK
jgi:hypothetical protein